MNRDELIAGIESKLRGLRSCDTQATAVAWMSDAYRLMEACLKEFEGRPERLVHVVREKLVYVPAKPTLQIAQNIQEAVVARHPAAWPGKTPTVVYPEVFLHPGLKPAPKAWTHADTVRLERAMKTPATKIQKQGR